MIVSTVALDTMPELAMGICVEFGLRGILNGSEIPVFSFPGERLRGVVVCLMSSLINVIVLCKLCAHSNGKLVV